MMGSGEIRGRAVETEKGKKKKVLQTEWNEGKVKKQESLVNGATKRKDNRMGSGEIRRRTVETE